MEMKNLELLSKVDSQIRPYLSYLPSKFVISLYSSGRKIFITRLTKELPDFKMYNLEKTKKTLWNLNFGNSLFNAAGMFKNGEGYELAAAQGAGAYLCGTTTSKRRPGNKKFNIKTPFAPFPRSNSAINWMGLPNPGHSHVAKKISQIGHKKYCPIGASLSTDTGIDEKDAMDGLIEGLELYDKAAVCFMEINESCPNVDHGDHCELDSNGLDINMMNRLEQISKRYLNKRQRSLPVIVKFSNDTSIEQLPALIDLLVDLKFDGINLGNTSVKYDEHSLFIHKSEKKLFEFFTQNFGGGLSGNLLKANSLKIASFAANYINNKNIPQEFHVIRTGGIENAEDIKKSQNSMIALNQWFTGYFEAFSQNGHKLYKKIFKNF